MTELLEIREKIKLFYSRFESFILPVVKFLLAFIVLNTLNGKMGYMTQLEGSIAQLDNIAVVLIVSLMCSFLPTSAVTFFSVVFSLLYMYALSIEVALVGLCMYLVLFLLFFRFSPKDSLVVVLTPLLFTLRIPYVIPIAVGLVCGPASIVSVICGIGVYYLLSTVIDNASAISTMGESLTTAKLQLVIDGVLKNREMLVIMAAFAITALTVYLIRRLSIDYSWTIAMVSGALINIVILLIGDLIYDINVSLVSALLGTVLALVAAKIIEFFRFCVDYSRTEKVQFEDDEYYYYVRAVPKMTVSVSEKTVKKINTQRVRSSEVYERGGNVTQSQTGQSRAGQSRSGQSGAGQGRTGQSGAGRSRDGQGRAEQSRTGQSRVGDSRTVQQAGSRRVITERTAPGRGGSGVRPTRNEYRGRQSVTVGSSRYDDSTWEERDDFEED